MNPQQINKSTLLVRVTGIAYFFAVIWNFHWVVTSLNYQSTFSSFVSVIFLFATILVTISGIVLIINNWRFSIITPKKIKKGTEPKVAILIPTYNESIDIVLKTLESVVGQNWPKNKMVIVVSDDAYNEALEQEIQKFKLKNKITDSVIYHTPPRKNHPSRLGEAKAGNLNSALNLIIKRFPDISYIETRDADDLVGTKFFLSYCLEVLTKDSSISFVQTVKQCRVSLGDPFSNQEPVFYQRIMPARYASNAVFPCGSGLIWRIDELKKINGFPFWNLVEDLQSGYEILCLGGKSAFLPIVGAYGQIAPEDIPNFYKQRGTWALDTLRLFFWKNPFFEKRLNIWQKLQFFELEFSYFLSFAMAIFMFDLVIALAFGIYPILDSSISYILHIFVFAAILEIYNIARARGISYKELWRTRQIWLGLMPIFISAFFQALKYGPNNKPIYKTTRKYHKVDWYWRETLLAKFIFLTLLISIIISLVTQTNNILLNIGLFFWTLFFMNAFLHMIKNSWHGVGFKEMIKRRDRVIA